MTERHGGHMRMLSQRSDERVHLCRSLRINPELVIKALNELQVRFEVPGEFGEDLVLFVLSRKLRVDARLAIVIAQILITGKEPKPIALHRTSKIGCEVTITNAFKSAE